MTLLFTPEESGRLHRRSRIILYTACGLVAAAFALCVLFCLHTHTGNARAMLLGSIGVFTGAGWIAIPLLCLTRAPAEAEAKHIDSLLRETPQTFEGCLQRSDAVFRIPKSVEVRKVTLTAGEERQTLHVLRRKAALLPPDGAWVRVQCVRKYIIACEVCDETR